MSSYRQIFKASALIGGTSVLLLLIRMIGSKAIAVLVGPSGTGLANLYSSTAGFVGTIAGLGIFSSGVRRIALAHASGDAAQFARTVKVLRWTVRVTGLAGGLAVLLLCRPLSRFAFGDDLHSGGMALMGLVLLIGGVSAGQWALLQGMRRLADLAKSKIAGAVLGVISGITILWLLREKGILLLILVNALSAVLISWFYARKVQAPKISMTGAEVAAEVRALLNMGIAFLISSLVGASTVYLARVLVSRELGIASVGLYTASVALSTIFVGFVLESMSADFYPRLSAVANDHSEMNRMVNEQTEMALLLSIPAIIATIALAPLIMEIFFSAKFIGAVDVLRWQVLGMALKVISWPMGFITLAKARRDVFMATETGYGLVNIGLLFLCIRRFGLVGAGMALFATYFIYIVVCCIVSYRLSGFRWSTASLCTLGSMTFAAGGAFAAVTCIESAMGMGIAACIACAVAAGSFIRVKTLLNVNPLAIIRKRLGI